MKFVSNIGANNWSEAMSVCCLSGNFSLFEYFFHKGMANVDSLGLLLIKSLQFENYSISLFLLTKGANINYESSEESPIHIVFESKNVYAIYFLLFNGAKFTHSIQKTCLEKIWDLDTSKFQQIVTDYNNHHYGVQKQTIFP